MTKTQWVARELRNIVLAGLILVTTATALGFVAAAHSMFDWFADFRMVYAICALVPLAAWLRHDRRVAGVAAAVVVVNSLFLIPWAPTDFAPCDPDISAISVNAFGTISDKDELMALLRGHDADIVFVSEMSRDLTPRMTQLYPTAAVFEDAPFMGIFTRFRIIESELRRSPGGRPYISALLDTPSGPLRVIGAHTAAPFNANASADRNQNLRELADLARSAQDPVILLGDLNATMFSPFYAPLEEAGLANVRHHKGVNGTWPSFSPIRIPIDHMLHSSELQTCNVEVGHNFRSDHLPLLGSFRWRQPSTAGALALR